jgi:hypothetical protein
MKLTLTRIVEVNGRGEYQKSFILEKIWCDWFVHLIESYLIIICMSPIHNVVETFVMLFTIFVCPRVFGFISLPGECTQPSDKSVRQDERRCDNVILFRMSI